MRLKRRVSIDPSMDPDQAWKALGVVNDWIRHAETKTGATLAVAGVIGATLYNLVKDQAKPELPLIIAASACAALLIGSVICAVIALLPRLGLPHSRSQDSPSSPLFFGHIASAHKTAQSYVELLAALTTDRAELTREIAAQVHSNAHVASRKYDWANRALWFLFLAVLSISVVAGTLVVGR